MDLWAAVPEVAAGARAVDAGAWTAAGVGGVALPEQVLQFKISKAIAPPSLFVLSGVTNAANIFYKFSLT